MGKIFNLIVRCLGLSSFHDTQCGFKLLRAREAREIFSHCRIQRFAFDVELLFVARALGYQTAEVAISWRHVPESRVRPVRDAARMLWDVIELRLHPALLHGPEQIADLPVPVGESPGAVGIGHAERGHLVEYLAPNSVFNSLPRQRSSPHLGPHDRLVTIDRVLHHASLGAA